MFVQPGLTEAKTRSRHFRNHIVAIMNLLILTKCLFIDIFLAKKSLKISKGPSEAVNRRRTDNTMAKK